MTHLPNNHICIEIPEDARLHEFVLSQITGSELAWLHFLDEHGKDICRCEQLPPGEWILVGTSESLKEEECEKIVDVAVHMEDFERLVKDRWWNYTNEGILKTARESFTSLLKSLNLNSCYAILKMK